MICIMYINFAHPESIAPPFTNQTPVFLGNHPPLSPKWFDQPSVSRGVRSSGLSFPGNCDWSRDEHVTHSGPMRCNETVAVASGSAAVSCLSCSQEQEIRRLKLSGRGAQRPGDTCQDLVTSSEPLGPVVPEMKNSLHFVVT